MMHIDDDEFITMNSTFIPKERKRPLYDYAQKVFRKNPAVAALSFAPVAKYNCPLRRGESDMSSLSSEVVLPRIGVWTTSFMGVKFEAKLLMKTCAVRMFFVHYVSQIEKMGKYQEIAQNVNVDEVAMLHYRADVDVGGLSIWGNPNLTGYEPRNLSIICGKNYGRGENDYFPEGTKPFIHRIDSRLVEALKEKFLARNRLVDIQKYETER
jgi:hypothetical protein